MPRKRRTAEEASAVNAQKWNRRQREALPLFMQAGMEEQLVEAGLIRDRAADHQIRAQHTLHERMAALDARCTIAARAYASELKKLNRPAWAEALLHLRRMRGRFNSMRRPVNSSDYWQTALRKAVTPEQYLDVLDRHNPEHAQTVRFTQSVNERIARKLQHGEYNGWR